MTAKPTVEELGIDVAAQEWHRSGEGEGAIEIAFTRAPEPGTRAAAPPGEPAGPGQVPAGQGAGPAGPARPPADQAGPGAGDEWVLMRVAGDPAGRVLVYDRHEWECFLDGVKKGEFDDARP